MINKLQQNFAVSPRKSIRQRLQQMGIPRSLLRKILTKDLRLHAYKIQLVQQLKLRDHRKSKQLCKWIEETGSGQNFCKKKFFSDEAHFHLCAFVNKQNWQIWGPENPRVVLEDEMHSSLRRRCGVVFGPME